MYADNTYKFVAVLNEKIELPPLMTALGHMTAGLVAQADETTIMRFLQYEDADGGRHPAISHYPFIVLAARNSNQLRTLRQCAIDQQLLYNDFVNTMLGSSAADQQQRTRATSEASLEYIGICLFGPSELLHGLTRKFSLFRARSGA